MTIWTAAAKYRLREIGTQSGEAASGQSKKSDGACHGLRNLLEQNQFAQPIHKGEK